MWTSAQLSVELDAVDGWEAILIVRTPVGPISILASVSITGIILSLDGVHVSGPGPGTVTIAGIHDIAQKIMEELDVQEILAQGGTRTTGRRNGKIPRRFRFVRRQQGFPAAD